MFELRRGAGTLMLLTLTVSPPRAAAQMPASRRLRINEVVEVAQDTARLAVAADGSHAVLWPILRRPCPEPRLFGIPAMATYCRTRSPASTISEASR
jgi:hypothetical protein